MLIDAHTHAFAALGGVPSRGIYDNIKTSGDKVTKGKGRTVNARFAVCARTTFSIRTSARRLGLGKRHCRECPRQPPAYLAGSSERAIFQR